MNIRSIHRYTVIALAAALFLCACISPLIVAIRSVDDLPLQQQETVLFMALDVCSDRVESVLSATDLVFAPFFRIASTYELYLYMVTIEITILYAMPFLTTPFRPPETSWMTPYLT